MKQIRGWVATVRKMKNWAFAEIQTGNSPNHMSVVMPPQQAEPLTTGACVEISGQLQSKPNSADQELRAETTRILGLSNTDYPLQKKYHSPEFIRQLPQFRWRTRTAGQVLRYRSWAIGALGDYFRSIDAFQCNCPLITSSDCEGAGEVFELKGSKEFFGKSAYMTVSAQLHLEVFCQALSRVWNLTTAFRAEASDTNRHLSEFWMVEGEFAFVDMDKLLEICENMVRSTVPNGQMAADLISSKRSLEVQQRIQDRWALLQGKWNRITYTEAIDIIETAISEQKIKTPVTWGEGLASEHEKYLAGQHFKSPVFVTDYPTAIKPFYMKGSSENTVACFDLLIPEIGELAGGSIREDNYDVLVANMERYNMDPSHMTWYTDLRKYGSFPHGGYGLGFERLIMYICGLDNIRDASGFIRTFNSLQC